MKISLRNDGQVEEYRACFKKLQKLNIRKNTWVDLLMGQKAEFRLPLMSTGILRAKDWEWDGG